MAIWLVRLLPLLAFGCVARATAPRAQLTPLSREEVPPDPSPGCFRKGQPFDGSGVLLSGGTVRHYLLRLPAGARAERPAPLVLNFPGLAEAPSWQELLTDMTAAARLRGMAVVYPEGVGWSWNAGSCCGRAWVEGLDDVRFVRELVEQLEQEHCLDRRRIYATGMSNGGLFSYRLACEASDLVAAIAPVAAVEVVERCAPTRPVPVLAFHGTDDFVVRYGGGLWSLPSTTASVDRWARRDRCAVGPGAQAYSRGEVQCIAEAGCAEHSDVVLCAVRGGGHTWPGGAYVPWLGHTTPDLDATSAILDFFLAHPRREPLTPVGGGSSR